jgi:uncharacterized membrane protein
MKKSVFSSILKYFVQGLLFITPVTITLYVIYNTVGFFDKLFPYLKIPGLGLILVLVSITLFGVLASTIIVKPLLAFLEDLIRRIPLLNLIYTPVKEFMTAVVGDKRKFKEPVLVKISENGQLYKLGFVTNRDLSKIGLTQEMIAVYLPHSYAFSGNLFVVPAENVTPIEAQSTEVMKFILTAGVTEIGVKQNP